MVRVVFERDEPKLLVEALGRFVDCLDFDGVDSHAIAQSEAAVQSVGKQIAAKALSLRARINGEPCQENYGNRMARQLSCESRRDVRERHGSRCERVIADDALGVRSDGNVSPAESTLFVLTDARSEKLIEGCVSAGKRSTLVRAIEPRDDPLSHDAVCTLRPPSSG